ncbi:MAG: hypothetical protein Q4C70_05465 [Planctomycetia bacterium]|nr:hypothetical protein [Planctomycetia bacterium]
MRRNNLFHTKTLTLTEGLNMSRNIDMCKLAHYIKFGNDPVADYLRGSRPIKSAAGWGWLGKATQKGVQETVPEIADVAGKAPRLFTPPSAPVKVPEPNIIPAPLRTTETITEQKPYFSSNSIGSKIPILKNRTKTVTDNVPRTPDSYTPEELRAAALYQAQQNANAVQNEGRQQLVNYLTGNNLPTIRLDSNGKPLQGGGHTSKSRRGTDSAGNKTSKEVDMTNPNNYFSLKPEAKDAVHTQLQNSYNGMLTTLGSANQGAQTYTDAGADFAQKLQRVLSPPTPVLLKTRPLDFQRAFTYNNIMGTLRPAERAKLEAKLRTLPEDDVNKIIDGWIAGDTSGMEEFYRGFYNHAPGLDMQSVTKMPAFNGNIDTLGLEMPSSPEAGNIQLTVNPQATGGWGPWAKKWGGRALSTELIAEPLGYGPIYNTYKWMTGDGDESPVSTTYSGGYIPGGSVESIPRGK